MGYVICFIVGALCGVFTMALVSINRYAESVDGNATEMENKHDS